MTFDWLNIAKRLESIAQTGFTYSKDDYDKERYQEIRDISHKIFNLYTEAPIEKIQNLFSKETGYPTPKVDIRGVIFRKNQILLVKEKSDGLWALPGGWADIGYTPSEVAVKEVKEEAGLNVKSVKLVAVFDKKCHAHPPSALHVYKMFILCVITGGRLKPGMETSEAAFFSRNDIPDLSVERNTFEQIQLLFDYEQNPEMPTQFD
jgi:ADP-ribose pyrophosphatase YjhB (NUDIX family)